MRLEFQEEAEGGVEREREKKRRRFHVAGVECGSSTLSSFLELKRMTHDIHTSTQ